MTAGSARGPAAPSRRPGPAQVTGVVALLAVVAAVLLGPASGDPRDAAPAAPTPATSPAEFCARFTELAQATGAVEAGQSTVGELQAVARDVADLAQGLPDLPPDARAGLDYVLGLLLGLPEDATGADLAAADDGSSIDDSADATALATWLDQTCPR